MDYQQPDYIQINQRPDLNQKYAIETHEGEKLTQEESLFIYYMVAGLSRVEAFIKAGFILPRTSSRDDSSSNEPIVNKAILQGVLDETENLPGSAEKEKEEKCASILNPLLVQTQITSLVELQKQPLEVRTAYVNSSRDLARIPKIAKEITYRTHKIQDMCVADAHEIYSYLTAVMRGQVKDQFGLEASLQERTRAAEALAKRLIDMPAKLQAATAWAEQGAVTINIQPRVVERVEHVVEATEVVD